MPRKPERQELKEVIAAWMAYLAVFPTLAIFPIWGWCAFANRTLPWTGKIDRAFVLTLGLVSVSILLRTPRWRLFDQAQHPAVSYKPYRFGTVYALATAAYGGYYGWLAFRSTDWIEILFLIASAFPLVGGAIGLLRRRRYGLILTGVELVIGIVTVSLGIVESKSIHFIEAAVLIGSVLVATYFCKRVREFLPGFGFL